MMDDEEIICDGIAELLQELGYEADFAREGTEAITLYEKARRTGRPYRAIIMDLTIPGGMGGAETMRKLLEIDPRTTAIVSSGYSEDPVMATYREHGFNGVLVKPFTLEELADVLEKAVTRSA